MGDNNRLVLMLWVGFVACLGLDQVYCLDIQTVEYDRDPLLSGFVFTENLLYERKGTSKIGCAKTCMETDRCVTFTFTPVTSADGVCRGHSAFMSLCKAHDVSAGTALYARRKEPAAEKEDWLYSACTGNQDCTQPNSRCFRGECTCTQGYYYSVSFKMCRETCSPADLQDSYLAYPGAVTHDSSGFWAGLGFSLDLCKQACTSTSHCLNCEYRESDGKCILEDINPRDKLASVWYEGPPASSSWNYYQRKCC